MLQRISTWGHVAWQPFAQAIERVATDPNDSDDLRVRKTLAVAFSGLLCLVGLVWGLGYLFVGARAAAAIALTYTALNLLNTVVFWRLRRFELFLHVHFSLNLVFPFILLLALGGIRNSSAVILWALIPSVEALLLRDCARRWRGLPRT